ncbi:MAG TPA: phage regulatory CII family protein [Devosia sp.]|jgi:hypothetical protein|nr:phage regulatory CII family protein [Devosia sp.]
MSAPAGLPIPFWVLVKDATARTSDDLHGDKVLVAVSTRISSHQFFSYYSSIKHVNRVVPFDTAIELDKYNLAHGGQARHFELAARELGYLPVRIPTGRGPAKVMEASGRSAQEMGALMMELGQSLSDGKLSGPERAIIHERIRHLQVDLAELDAAVAAEAEAQ